MIEEIFKETQPGVVIIGMNKDISNDNLILLKNIHHGKGTFETKFVIYNQYLHQNLFEITLTNPELIGRFISGACKIIDSHIYYGNFVMKLRHDVIKENPNAILTEDQVFNYYPHLFEIEENERIMERAPLIDTTYRRMVFIITNK